ncbi:hypothetical protein H9Q72_004978 [Fusarium xylarioides]|uniref:Uncharacterized protein n=1 Tax=Fusarium xylarioides TaxID=221167 RepID=A0A9P7LAT4_9HYPO|nr:hypothetical protein H9Q70_013183 [Fusarium xylarioides]KAG5766968.1 hypothetical protein H9Q72_004978 [Fusarium xylarioides]
MGVVATHLTSPDKKLLSPDSIYIDAEEGLRERSRLHVKNGTKPEEFARLVVKDVLKKKTALSKGEYIWRGTNAYIVWLLNAIGWRKIFDGISEGGVGLTKDVKKSIQNKGQGILPKAS